MVRCCVFFILLYRMENRTVTEATEKRSLKCGACRVLKISRMDRVRDTDVFIRMKKEIRNRTNDYNKKKRKLEYFGHIMSTRKINKENKKKKNCNAILYVMIFCRLRVILYPKLHLLKRIVVNISKMIFNLVGRACVLGKETISICFT